MFRHKDTRPTDGEEDDDGQQTKNANANANGGGGGGGGGLGSFSFFASHSWEGSREKVSAALTRAKAASETVAARAKAASERVKVASQPAISRAKAASQPALDRLKSNPTVARLVSHPALARFLPAPAPVYPEEAAGAELSPVEFLDSPTTGTGAGGAKGKGGGPEGGEEETKSEDSSGSKKGDRLGLKATGLFSDSDDEEDEDDIWAEEETAAELPPPEPGSFAFYVDKVHGVCPLLVNVLIFSCFTPKQLRDCCRPPTRFVDNGTVVVGRNLPGQSQADYDRINKLEIDDNVVNQLYAIFENMDRRRSGGVTFEDFFDFFGFSESPMSRRIFGMLDRDQSGEIDFREFVLVVWNVCTLSRNGLAMFCFLLFDENNSGFLEPEEVEELVTSAYGVTTGHEERVRRVMRTLDPDDSQAVTKSDFLKYNNVNPLLLYPAYQFQAQLQVCILGKKWWHKIADVRTERFRQNNIFEILDLFNTEPEFKKWVIYEDLSRPVRKENIDEHPLRNVESHSSAGHHPHPEHWRHRHDAWN